MLLNNSKILKTLHLIVLLIKNMIDIPIKDLMIKNREILIIIDIKNRITIIRTIEVRSITKEEISIVIINNNINRTEIISFFKNKILCKQILNNNNNHHFNNNNLNNSIINLIMRNTNFNKILNRTMFKLNKNKLPKIFNSVYLSSLKIFQIKTKFLKKILRIKL